jgi:hypothetical protein
MKSITHSILILLSSIIIGNISNAQDELPALEGPYLGQTSVGMTPEIFAPGLVSTMQRDGSGFF